VQVAVACTYSDVLGVLARLEVSTGDGLHGDLVERVDDLRVELGACVSA
jgi:hypothetical protein